MATLSVRGTDVKVTLTSEEKIWLSSYRHAAIDVTLVGLDGDSWNARSLATSPRRVWEGPGSTFLKRRP